RTILGKRITATEACRYDAVRWVFRPSSFNPEASVKSNCSALPHAAFIPTLTLRVECGAFAALAKTIKPEHIMG
ncbi:MAG: hypothetical protein ACFCU9_16450, partial [Cyanophyceae cyanobacterium]